jgi:hypothetical protein
MIFNDRRKGNTAIKRALKAANGPALTKDKNLSDATSRGVVISKANNMPFGTRKQRYAAAAQEVEKQENPYGRKTGY